MEITINYYGQAVSVSVEVYEYLTQADHKAENHKGLYTFTLIFCNRVCIA